MAVTEYCPNLVLVFSVRTRAIHEIRRNGTNNRFRFVRFWLGFSRVAKAPEVSTLNTAK